MPNTPLSKVPYPSGSDAPAAAADMMAAFMALDDRLVLKAVDEADRNARYAEAPVSTIVISGQSRRAWIKTGTGPTDWYDWLYDTGWVGEGFTVYDGWNLATVEARKRNGYVDLRGEVTRSGDGLTASSNGHLPNIDVITVPPQFRPETGKLAITGQGKTPVTSGAIELYASGRLALCDLHPNSTLSNGDYLRFSLGYLGA